MFLWNRNNKQNSSINRTLVVSSSRYNRWPLAVISIIGVGEEIETNWGWT